LSIFEIAFGNFAKWRICARVFEGVGLSILEFDSDQSVDELSLFESRVTNVGRLISSHRRVTNSPLESTWPNTCHRIVFGRRIVWTNLAR
jgi:hypothetical protein